jgi:hypothetical protein
MDEGPFIRYWGRPKSRRLTMKGPVIWCGAGGGDWGEPDSPQRVSSGRFCEDVGVRPYGGGGTATSKWIQGHSYCMYVNKLTQAHGSTSLCKYLRERVPLASWPRVYLGTEGTDWVQFESCIEFDSQPIWIRTLIFFKPDSNSILIRNKTTSCTLWPTVWSPFFYCGP